MSEQIKNEFVAINGLNCFHRVDMSHPLNLYIGRDQIARCTLLLISPNVPQQIFSSRIISVDVGQRSDGQWALSLSLANEKFMDLYCHFCDDIIDSSRLIPDVREDMIFVCGRYEKWQEMLRKNRDGLLSETSVKGLIGELLFLRDYLFPVYGINEALDSWIGPEYADQDFVCPEKWYEVKATTSGNESVCISSIEQLDSSNNGELVIVYLDKTSQADPKKITLNSLVSAINETLTFEQHRHFRDILLRQEYIPRKEYDQYAYSFSAYSRYNVGDEFPSLRRKNIPDTVVKVNYHLSIPGISKYHKED